ncbi:MAG: hypothetical protein GY859_11615, partial [Desulfobacterales bacterium]|nr:hypothetical protein [Desulfobacterales bacterium]
EAVPGAILQARSLLEKLENANEALHSFKGVGTVRIQKENSTWSSRLVLAGASPDKLRVEVLAVPGRSAASMATDGEWLYFDPHTPGQFYKKSASNVHLDPILSIPIPAGDLIALLSGKTPIRPHHHITLAPGGPDGEGRVLTLRGRWRRILQKIHFDNNEDAPRMIEIFRGSGVLKYRAVFEETRLVQGFRTPSLLALSSKNGAALRLRLHQYHVNAPVNPSMFVLAPPN